MKLYLKIWPGNGVRPSLGNNLFCYLAKYIIQKQFGHEFVDTKEELNGDNIKQVDDTFWNDMCNHLEEKPLEAYRLDKHNICMEGFYQDSRILLPNREYLLTLMKNTNHEYFCHPSDPHPIRISDLINAKKEFVDKETLVVHLRLDDFKHYHSNSEIIHPNCYFRILDTILEKNPTQKILIVVDKIRHSFEEKYISLFTKRYTNIEVRTGHHYLEDFAFLMTAKRIVVSNSTFCWLAAFLGDATETYVIKNRFHPVQNLGAINQNSVLSNIEYISPEEILQL